jgi:hypothetical protein
MTTILQTWLHVSTSVMNDKNQSDFFFFAHSVHILKIIVSTNTCTSLNTFRNKYQTPTYIGTDGRAGGGGGHPPRIYQNKANTLIVVFASPTRELLKYYNSEIRKSTIIELQCFANEILCDCEPLRVCTRSGSLSQF